jgi:hypothetical protein
MGHVILYVKTAGSGVLISLIDVFINKHLMNSYSTLVCYARLYCNVQTRHRYGLTRVGVIGYHLMLAG